MKVTLNVDEFQEVIKKAQKSTPKKSSLKILSNVKLSTNNNKITLISTDLETTVIYDLSGDILEPGEILLSLETLKLIAKLKNTYELTINNNSIIAGNKTLKYVSWDSEEFPQIQDDCNKQAFTITQQELIKAFSINYACGTEESRPIFTGVNINKNKFVATNTYRLAWNETSIENTMEQGVIITNSAVKLLSGTLLDKKSNSQVIVSYNDKYQYLKLEFEGIKVITRLIDGQFPNFNQVIPKDFTTTIRINTKTVLDELSFIEEIAKQDKTLSFAVDKENLYIDAMAEGNAVTLTIPCESITGDRIECQGIDYFFLVDALKNAESNVIEIKFPNGSAPIYFGNSIVVPIKIKDQRRRNIA